MYGARSFKKVLTLSATLLALGAGGMAHAEQKEVTIAYQQIAGPLLTVIADGSAEKATGYKINWRQFESGAKVGTAMASGDVQIGVIGSSPLAAAVSRGLPLQLFWILDDINEAEAMVVRNGSGITKPADLKGKKLGVPFVSTTHFHTMFALNLWGIKPSELEILNMQPNQIAAAWERGDIDAAYVWDPALARIKQSGKVLITSGELSKKGKATFDGIAVSRAWADANPAFMASFTKAIANADAAFRANPQAWGTDSAQAKTMAKMLGGTSKDAADAIKLYAYPTLQQQISPAWLGGGKTGGAVKALKATAEFLKEQKRIDALAPDYSAFVTSKYAEAALKQKQ
ncbi:taurine ABC transporter substrate-binding protein [Pseudogulbenkiania subflava]|uniref:Taurine transport system substrate-binding protein n=1 Tax=Pseudogulbenkiania subflava DSM 22618 TaxID=1123014 RepID=A0A1Y6C635_9NEIS|nr:taurine ABC transporter substrate-binding protein [Pseudogulbenkiania subflava]SMF46022.1 taurine transport system substrate-binding protein [Pseudogulbenkiania subflava DSM 22618]